MNIEWRKVALPDLGEPDELPGIPAKIYEQRCRTAYARSGCDWLAVYGDREHFANLTYLTNFDPRFEEALLLLGPGDRRILVVGNEGMGYTSQAGLPLEFALCQSFSLLGQDRTSAPRLSEVLRQVGIKAGQRIGVVGWKYLEPQEWTGRGQGFFTPACLVDALREIAGDPDAVVDSTSVLMHPTDGLRSKNEPEQILAFEWGATRASNSVLRMVQCTQPGKTEIEIASGMGYGGDPLTCHVMFTTGKDEVVGLRSPSGRRVERGAGVSTAVGFWGGLCCRAGLVIEEQDDFLTRCAMPYFRGLVAWYTTVRIGVTGDEVFRAVSQALAGAGLRSSLNPGHLTGHDEWVHTPIRPGSAERLASGMGLQCDIIPVPMPSGYTINCEDTFVLADADLRKEISRLSPGAWARIQARQAFMRQDLGLAIFDDLLPLSTYPAYLFPCWLSPTKVLAVS